MKLKFTFLFLLVLIVLAFNISAQMRVHIINVGQGNATLIEFPCAAVLIDVGGESNSLYNSSEVLKNYLENFFDRRTDLDHTFQCVFLNHPHSDHTLGVPVILQSPYKIKNVVTDGLERGSGKPGQIKLHRAVQDSEETPDRIGFEAITTDKIGDAGLTNTVIDPVDCSGTNPLITVLWGTSATNPGWNTNAFNNENNHSLMIKFKYGASSLLITGDLEDVAQKSLLKKYANSNLLNADVYLVGHHGSKNGTTKELLDKITPKIAVIGVGNPERNIPWTAWAYGHPNKQVLEMLQERISTTRTPIEVQAATGAKKFSNYTIKKAIYSTAWDDNIVLEANAVGNWTVLETATEKSIVPSLVNINTVLQSELESLPGISSTKAKAIIDFRTNHGNFTSLDDLDKVPGIGPATLNLLKPYIKFE